MREVEVKKIGLLQKTIINAAAYLDQLLQNNVDIQKVTTKGGVEIKIINEKPGVTIILIDDIMILC